MAQFDVYENIHSQTKENIPYLLDIQNDILKNLNTRVVIPLAINQKTIEHLSPIFQINNLEVTMLTTQLAGVPISALGDKVCNLEDKRSDIINAIDFMITGF